MKSSLEQTTIQTVGEEEDEEDAYSAFTAEKQRGTTQ
jgi:hypothetical protein